MLPILHDLRTRFGATLHEIRCAECRVSWSSWAHRFVYGG